jgi:hypothetical protein
MYLLIFSVFTLTFGGNIPSDQLSATSSLCQPLKAKTLELRYSTKLEYDKSQVEINGKTFKIFTDKKSAVDYYYFIKKDAPQKVVFYVISEEDKEREVYTFRAVE